MADAFYLLRSHPGLGNFLAYQLIIDMAGKISNINAFDDNDGVKVLTYTFDAVYDSAWSTGRYLRVQLQNKTATL